MILSIKPTEDVVSVGGQPCRVWDAWTPKGNTLRVYVADSQIDSLEAVTLEFPYLAQLLERVAKPKRTRKGP
jgi:hypothetical protein